MKEEAEDENEDEDDGCRRGCAPATNYRLLRAEVEKKHAITAERKQPPRRQGVSAMLKVVTFVATAVALAVVSSVAAAADAAAPAASQPTGKIKLLILSGANNHNWQATTPALKKMYEDSGRFAVDVADDVPHLTGADFAKYDCIVSNYTTYPVVAGKRWPAETEKAFLDYISAGHGLVLFHAASTAWGDWPEFTDLIGITWQTDPATGKNISGHGAYHAFKIAFTATEHPITKGMKDFVHAPDELYHRQKVHATAKVLATAFSDKAKGGSGQDEPMIVVTELGKGRCFHNGMGHDAKAMEGPGFQALMLRGAEWAATGKVTIPPPAEK